MIDLVKLLRLIVLSNPERQMQYQAIQMVLGIDKPLAKKLLFSWIYRAEQSTLVKILHEGTR